LPSTLAGVLSQRRVLVSPIISPRRLSFLRLKRNKFHRGNRMEFVYKKVLTSRTPFSSDGIASPQCTQDFPQSSINPCPSRGALNKVTRRGFSWPSCELPSCFSYVLCLSFRIRAFFLFLETCHRTRLFAFLRASPGLLCNA